MNYLLLGGTSNVGKSESIWRITEILLRREFTIIDGNIPPFPLPIPTPIPFPDYIVTLKGKNRAGDIIYILINTATDDPQKINEFKNKIDSQKNKIDIIISSIRDSISWPREYFFNTIRIDKSKDFLLEIPLAKIHRQRKDFSEAITWYQQSLDTLILHNLANQPFNI